VVKNYRREGIWGCIARGWDLYSF